MRRTAIAALLIAGLFGASAAAQDAALTSPSASTEGRASIKVAPDVAWISVSAESRAVRPADAQRQNAAAMDAVRASLKHAGLPDDAVKTRSYTVEPEMQYTNGKPKVIGYITRQTLDARIDDLARLGAVIDAAGASGASSISNIRYDVKDRAAIETRLLGEAVRDGLLRARAMAAGAGKEVMTVWRIEEQRMSDSAPQPMYRVAMETVNATAPSTQVTPDEIEIQARVSITVILK